MTAALNFQKPVLDKLKSREKQYEVRDQKVHGLTMRISPGGSKMFNLLRKVNGKTERIKLGRYPDISIENARKMATRLNGQIAEGTLSPSNKVVKNDLTFSDLFASYYSDHLLPHTKRAEETKTLINLHLIPHFGKDRLQLITPERIKKHYLTLCTDSGKGQANKVTAFGSAIFNFGIKEEYFKGNNPYFGLKKFKNRNRDRFLNQDELKCFFKALELEDLLFRDFFTLSLFIGARKSTMLAMKYGELDLNLNRWRLSEDQSKNGDVNVYVLSNEVVEILERRKAANQLLGQPSVFVFPGEGKSGHLQDPKKAFKRIKERMGVTDLRIHDLRRTLGSYMAISNASLPIIGKALNHKSQQSTAIYARLSQAPVLEALNTATKAMVERTSTSKTMHFSPNYQIESNVRFNKMVVPLLTVP